MFVENDEIKNFYKKDSTLWSHTVEQFIAQNIVLHRTYQNTHGPL